jgi:hypothetical protein
MWLLLLSGCSYYYPPSIAFQYLGDRHSSAFSIWAYGNPYTPYYLYYPRWYYQLELERPYFYYKEYWLH